MINKAFLVSVAFFSLHCQGLELTFNSQSLDSSSIEFRKACGILTCAVYNRTASDSADHDVTSDFSPFAEITSMKIFRVKSDSKTLSLLALLSPQNSRLNRVSNGIRVEGHLVTGRASLQLKFNKEADCHADYVCQVNGSDTSGQKVLKTSQISQVIVKVRDQENGSDLNSRLTMRVLDLLQEMNANLAVTSNVVGKLEDELNRVGETTEHRLESLKHDLEERINSLEDKNGSENKRLEDKLEDVNKNLEAKADRVEDKLESTKDRLEDSIKSQTSNTKGIEIAGPTSCKHELNEEFRRNFKVGMGNLESKISQVQEDLAELGTSMSASVEEKFTKLDKETLAEVGPSEISVQNVTNIPVGTSCEEIDRLSRAVDGGFSTLSSSLNNKFSELSLNLQSSISNILKPMTEQYMAHSSHESENGMLYTVPNSIIPKTCYKGMSIYVPSAANKYIAIEPSSNNYLNIPVLCDMRTDAGGWVVIQRRVLGDVDFYRGWLDYKHGFGALHGNFWLGNDNIHNFTSSGEFELRIDMKYGGGSAFAQYGSFSIKDEAGKYALNVSSFSGTAGDSFNSAHNGAAFTTYDQDNDKWGNNCAVSYTGAWWYNACHHSNLNGQWAAKANKGLRWNTYSSTNSVTFSEMKIRRLVGKTV